MCIYFNDERDLVTIPTELLYTILYVLYTSSLTFFDLMMAC
jgi:hypothetical protein